MRQTNVNRVSVGFTEMLFLSCFILCWRFCSVEKIGGCRNLCSFYFQNCIFSTKAFMEGKKKKKKRNLQAWGVSLPLP